MRHDHSSKMLTEQLNTALVEHTFIHYRCGFLDGYTKGYRQGADDTTESNVARAEHAAQLFYAMTAKDADWRLLTQAIGAAADVAEARREAGEWARKHCTFAGGPVDFLTGEPVETGDLAK